MLRAVKGDARLTPPDISAYNLPELKLCEGENDVTLKRTDFGRGFEVYKVGALFGFDDMANPTADAWRTIAQVVLSAWGIAEATSIHPDEINAWTKCSKKTLKDLRKWTFIRSSGYYPPNEDGAPGDRATEEDREWAMLPFNDF